MYQRAVSTSGFSFLAFFFLHPLLLKTENSIHNGLSMLVQMIICIVQAFSASSGYIALSFLCNGEKQINSLAGVYINRIAPKIVHANVGIFVHRFT